MAAAQDPFDTVLHQLRLKQTIEKMDEIQIAEVPADAYSHDTVPCHMRVQNSDGKLVALADIRDAEVRHRMALKFIKFIHPGATHIRPISLTLNVDGTVEAELLTFARPAHEQPNVYPARYRIPPFMISDLPLQERVWRAEKFALGVLLYELLSGRRIFEGEQYDDAAVQAYYRTAAFPGLETLSVIHQCLIYACWSAEFGRSGSLTSRVNLSGRFQRYVHEHPLRFGLQVAGGLFSIAALITVPILGAVGFTAAGPAAGTAAAAWQASIGLVEAGSLFALCQSAAMGARLRLGWLRLGSQAALLWGPGQQCPVLMLRSVCDTRSSRSSVLGRG